jgi:hypothetical protein
LIPEKGKQTSNQEGRKNHIDLEIPRLPVKERRHGKYTCRGVGLADAKESMYGHGKKKEGQQGKESGGESERGLIAQAAQELLGGVRDVIKKRRLFCVRCLIEVRHEKVAIELPGDLCKIAFVRSPEIPGAQTAKKEQKSEQKDEGY